MRHTILNYLVISLLVSVAVAMQGCSEGGVGQVIGAQDNFPPETPKYPDPQQNSTEVDTALTLAWSSSDPDSGDVITYSVYLDTQNPPLTLVGTVTADTSFAVGGLTTETVYHWRVDASDGVETRTGQVWSFRTKYQGWEYYTRGSSPLCGDDIRAIAIDDEGKAWIGTGYDGLSVFDGAQWKTYNSGSGLPGDEVVHVHLGAGGLTWISCLDKGVAYTADGSVWRVPQKTKQADFTKLRVRKVIGDSRGNELLCTSTGLAQLTDSATSLFNSLTTPNFVSTNIWDATLDTVSTSEPLGRILMATDKGLESVAGAALDSARAVVRLKDTTLVTIKYRTQRVDRPETTTVNGALKIVVKTTFPIDSIVKTPVIIDTTFVSYNYLDSSWRVTDADTVMRTDTAKVWDTITTTIHRGTYRSYYNLSAPVSLIDTSLFPDRQFSALAVDAEGNLWAATASSGLYKIRDGKPLASYTTANSPLPSNMVRCLALDNSGNLWIGTRGGGLARFDRTSNWRVFTTATSGIPSDHVFAVDFDNANRLWCGTARGVGVYVNR